MPDFVEQLPKVELHVHLEGSLRLPTIEKLAARNGVDVGSTRHLEEKYQFDGFEEFLTLFFLGLDVMRTGADIADVVDALAAELAAQNVRYAEVTTTAYSHQLRGIPLAEYAEGLNDGRRRAAARNVELAWIVDIPRELEQPDEYLTADFLTGPDAPEGAVAIGLGGPEYGSDPRKYAAAFARVRAAGLHSVPHAGEMDGPASVIGALDALHAERIGHGIRAIEDHELVQRLAGDGTPLEVCPTSNILLGAAASFEQHPLGALRDAGVVVTINSDDPAYFSTTLTDELRLAQTMLGLDDTGVRQLQLAALDASFAPTATKQRIRGEIESG